MDPETKKELVTYVAIGGILALPFVVYCIHKARMRFHSKPQDKKPVNHIYPDVSDVGSIVRIYERGNNYVDAEGNDVPAEQVGWSKTNTRTSSDCLTNIVDSWAPEKGANAYALKIDPDSKGYGLLVNYFKIPDEVN